MEENNLEKAPEKESEKRAKDGSTSRPAAKKERWKSLQSHLDQALNQWNEISEKMEGELSPDQKQLQEVKGLLQQLKSKLEQF